MKLGSLFGRTPDRSVPHEIYGAVMAQSRRREFFSSLGIADTVIGRAEILGLHLVLLTHRLSREGDREATALGQEVFDIHVRELERALRELGVGDTTVPKRLRKLVHGYYGQLDAFVPAIDHGDRASLVSAIAGRFHDGAGGEPAERLADYAMQSAARLENLPFSQISRGRLEWAEFDPTQASPQQ